MKIHVFTKKEEITHAITHGIGAILSVLALILLIKHASFQGNPLHIVSVTIFGSTMLLMYISSTVVHSLHEGKWKDRFQLFDHASIYLFIAGTYTPLLLIILEGKIGWILFGIIWSIAIIGIIFKVFFVKKFLILSTIIYILMGWLIILAWNPLVQSLPKTGLYLLVFGGVIYTIGAIFYVLRKIPYHHMIWHLFVLAGSTFHFFTIYYYVI